MSSAVATERAEVIAGHVDAAYAQLVELRAAASRMDDHLGDTDVAVFNLGTGHGDVHAAVIAVRVAREHVESAWRSLDYAMRNLTDR